MFIINRWRVEHTLDSIIVALYGAGHPLTKAEVLKVICNYVGENTENMTYRAKARSRLGPRHLWLRRRLRLQLLVVAERPARFSGGLGRGRQPARPVACPQETVLISRLLAVAALCLEAETSALAMTCGTRFIVEGQSEFQVLRLCGRPTWTTNRFDFAPTNPGFMPGAGGRLDLRPRLHEIHGKANVLQRPRDPN
jgi:hypothetical protein